MKAMGYHDNVDGDGFGNFCLTKLADEGDGRTVVEGGDGLLENANDNAIYMTEIETLHCIHQHWKTVRLP